jgi:hypothetical protein
MSSPVLITALLTALACASGPAGESVWGNERETFTILSDGARYEGLCLAGVTTEKITVDDAGNFSAHGTLRPKGGARRDDDAQQEVVFRGAIHGETMELTIERSDHTAIQSSTLKKGMHGTAHPCS